jgi:hypothetical protein
MCMAKDAKSASANQRQGSAYLGEHLVARRAVSLIPVVQYHF